MVKKKNCYKKYGTLFSGDSNPFNVKVNRKKHAVLGSDVKGTKGLPGISKGISYAKRKDFLKKNKVAAQKSNTFIDKRTLNQKVTSFDDQVTARFVREQHKKSKKNVFNLSGEKGLNHKTEPFKDLKTFDDSEAEENILGSSFISKNDFSADSNGEGLKSHKDLIEEKIADCKQKKMEKKMEKEKYLNALEQVDNAWREIHFMGSKPNSSNNGKKPIFKETIESNANDPFDISKNELKFEQKSSSISHTKSAEEIAKEEEIKHAHQEKEKLLRMNDNYELKSLKTSTHLSADAICDDYEYLQTVATEDKYEPSDINNDSDAETDESVSSFDEMDQEESDSESYDLPFNQETFMPGIPNDLGDFQARVKDCNAEQLGVVLENILKNSVKSKNEKVLDKLKNFFDILLQYAFECCKKKIPKLELIGALPPHLHLLANVVNVGAAESFLKLLDEEHQIFTACKKQNIKKNFPRHQTIVILKYTSLIYSTSDFCHPVVTPAMIFMCDILGSPFCVTFVNLLSRLFISALVLNCIEDSKRFVPEAVHFLNNVLLLADPVKSKSKKHLSCPKLFDLVITDKISVEDIPTLDLVRSNKELTEEMKKISIIFSVTKQLLQFAALYCQLPSFKEIFAPTLTACAQLPVHFYPATVEGQIKKLVEMGQKSRPLRQLSFEKAKPKPLKMFEPSFESRFNPKDDIDKKRKLIKKVAQKIKKENKSMLREIRRDAQVATAEKLKEKLELDTERKRKVKEIYGNLAVQEGEFKKMSKKKS